MAAWPTGAERGWYPQAAMAWPKASFNYSCWSRVAMDMGTEARAAVEYISMFLMNKLLLRIIRGRSL